MLGRPYAIAGQVIEGDKLGGQLGFPTANLDVAGLVLPPRGVYSGFTKLKRQIYRLALNIGFRPTMISGKPELRVEAHLLDFSGRLYGEELEIEISEKLRDERKFPSPAELRAQITRDIATMRERA
jgi:riboflavin kinase/FMN adenylyltransferase